MRPNGGGGRRWTTGTIHEVDASPQDDGTLVRAVVVDHWPLVSLGVTRVLEPLGVEVLATAADALEGLHEADQGGAHLVVLGQHADLSVAEAVRRAKALPTVPWVMALISVVDKDELSALVSAGVDALLLRTVGGVELADAIRAMLRGERVIAPALVPLAIGLVGPSGTHEQPATAGAVVLTRKEQAVLKGLASGQSNRELADTLFVTEATIKTHLAHIYAKLSAGNRHEAVARALALGLLG